MATLARPVCRPFRAAATSRKRSESELIYEAKLSKRVRRTRTSDACVRGRSILNIHVPCAARAHFATRSLFESCKIKNLASASLAGSEKTATREPTSCFPKASVIRCASRAPSLFFMRTHSIPTFLLMQRVHTRHTWTHDIQCRPCGTVTGNYCEAAARVSSSSMMAACTSSGSTIAPFATASTRMYFTPHLPCAFFCAEVSGPPG